MAGKLYGINERLVPVVAGGSSQSQMVSSEQDAINQSFDANDGRVSTSEDR